jgi:hypothetical protein
VHRCIDRRRINTRGFEPKGPSSTKVSTSLKRARFFRSTKLEQSLRLSRIRMPSIDLNQFANPFMMTAAKRMTSKSRACTRPAASPLRLSGEPPLGSSCVNWQALKGAAKNSSPQAAANLTRWAHAAMGGLRRAQRCALVSSTYSATSTARWGQDRVHHRHRASEVQDRDDDPRYNIRRLVQLERLAAAPA